MLRDCDDISCDNPNLNPRDEDYVPSNAEPEVETYFDATHEPTRSHRRILPDQAAECLYANWKSLIPTIVTPHLHYMSRTLGKPLSSNPTSLSVCNRDDCDHKSTNILCLLFDRKFLLQYEFESSRLSDFVTSDVVSCQCSTVAQVLVHFGLFPTAPAQPHMAVSIDLLAFYRALFERSCDAVNALASALHTHYVR